MTFLFVFVGGFIYSFELHARHYLTVLRCPEEEEEKLQNKPNTDLEVLIDFIRKMRMMAIMMLMRKLTDGRHCWDNTRS